MRRAATFLLSFGLAAASLRAEVVTLPAAASLQGLNPFFSDARVFNTSYAASLDVTATYRCFLGPCPAIAPQIHFALAPRESKAFDDIVASASPGGFDAHDTAGGVEFEFSGFDGQLVVTSRLYSNSPVNTVGMFIPGVSASRARALSVMTSIRHDPGTDPPSGFRTNAGLFNPNDQGVQVTFTLYDAARNRLGVPASRSVGAHSGVQINGIFEVCGVGGLATENAVLVVLSTRPVFTYAAVIDNRTADPIFVVGAPDQAAQFVTSTPTLTAGTPTKTNTPGGPTPTRTNTVPSATPSRTFTPGTPTATRTITLSPTITLTPSITLTPTITLSPTITFTPSITLTPSKTLTPTITFTPSKTFTVTRTATASATPTKTQSPTITKTPTITQTPTKTGTATASPTKTQIPTITQTPTKTITVTVAATTTATRTPTPIPNLVQVGPGGGTNFVPSIITITAGQTVTWQWGQGIGPHSTTSGTCDTNICVPGPVGSPNPLSWDSGNITVPPDPPIFTKTFPNNGVYTYFCKVHGVMMQGTVNVF